MLTDRKSWDANHHVDELDQNDDALLDITEVPNGTSERVKRRFEHADKDKNGWLSGGEVPAFFHPDSFPTMFPVLSLETLEDLDLNGDGLLALEELPPDTFLAREFMVVDDNADRFVDVKELIVSFKQNDIQRVKRLVREIINECDQDRVRVVEGVHCSNICRMAC